MPFSSFGLNADILRGIKDLAFTHPTPIQAAAIKPAVEGRDVLACAATGSGKTAAFLLPMLHRLMLKPHVAGVGGRRSRALILTPTRELAAQILEHLNALAVHTPISGATIIGGMSMGPQAHAFRTGTDILIATPGRLLDHLRQPYAKLDALEILVLDEADRMLDMGFLPDIRRILRVLPAKRQTLFFYATMPMEVRSLMNDMLRDPVTIQMERQSTPAAGITQAIYPVPQHLKTALLCKLLERQDLASVICFTRTKHRANRLAAALTARKISCVPIHGNRSQGQRTAAISGFKEGHFRVLVATDIAARGIDIAEVTHVVNFDCPHVAEDYIHRVGRTGRASALGDAFTFVSDEELDNLRTIERAVGKRLPRVTLPDFDYAQKPTERLEIPIAERIAAIRAEKARARSRQGARGGPQDHGRPGSGGPRPGAQLPHAGGQPVGGQSRPQVGSSSGGQGRSPGGGGGGGGQNAGRGTPGAWGQRPAGRGKFGHPRGQGKYHGPARPR